jgi:glycosyltransferase involved in cell wall biosynthesis
VVDLASSSVAEHLRYVGLRDPAPFLKRGLAERSPALIHAHFGVEGVYAVPLAERLSIPLVTTFHGFDATTTPRALLGSGKVSWVNYLMHRRALAARGSLFICVSSFIRERVLSLGFPEEHTLVHHIGVDTERFRPARRPSDEPVILHVARLVEKKGTAYLIDAFARVAECHRDARIVIVGAGPLRATLEARVAGAGLSNRVQFLGARPHAEVVQWLARAQVLVLPSVTAASGDAEGLGMVLLEAAACGLPVVGTRHGGIVDAVLDEESGFLVPERDVETLAARIDSLLGDAGLRARMGGCARALAVERFDLRRQTAKLEALYEDLS